MKVGQLFLFITFNRNSKCWDTLICFPWKFFVEKEEISISGSEGWQGTLDTDGDKQRSGEQRNLCGERQGRRWFFRMLGWIHSTPRWADDPVQVHTGRPDMSWEEGKEWVAPRCALGGKERRWGGGINYIRNNKLRRLGPERYLSNVWWPHFSDTPHRPVIGKTITTTTMEFNPHKKTTCQKRSCWIEIFTQWLKVEFPTYSTMPPPNECIWMCHWRL